MSDLKHKKVHLEITPILFIFGGLPGTGKSSLARDLAQHFDAVYIRIDTIEQTLRDRGVKSLYDEGYQVGFALALENVKNGKSVVADSTNPVEESRQKWRQVAHDANCNFIQIEVICSDKTVHKNRVESRNTDIPNLHLPNWDSITSREYHEWKTRRLVIDTAFKSVEFSQHELLQSIEHTLEEMQ